MSKLYFLNHQQEELTRFYLRESKQLPGLPDRGKADYLLVAKYEQRKWKSRSRYDKLLSSGRIPDRGKTNNLLVA